MVKKIIVLIFLLSTKGYSQNNLSIKIPVGLNWKTTPMNLINFNAVRYDYRIPFVGEWNTQVFSANLGLQLYSENFRIAVEYVPNFRHNYIHHVAQDSIISYPSSKHGTYEFIVDHQFRILKFFNTKSSSGKRQKYISLGYAINNAGKSVYVKNLSTLIDEPIRLDYSTLSVGVGFPIWQGIYFEPSINYIPKTFPNNKYDDLMTISLSLRYTINALNF